MEIRYAFAPGEGTAIQQLITQAISVATKRVRVASMVTSSGPILTALKDKIDAGISFDGIYDFGESTQVLRVYEQHPNDAEKAELLKAVLANMTPKHSQRFDDKQPGLAHNFMHNKIVVADDTIVTGSFNFSANALHNAENVIALTHPALASGYADYIDGLIKRYRS